MGCATKNAKVVAISLGSLQRLIALKAVPQSAVTPIINTMSDAMSQGVDIQLRILQTLVSLVMNFPDVHGERLGDVSSSFFIGFAAIDGDMFQGSSPMFQTPRIKNCRRFVYSSSDIATTSYVCCG